MEKLPTVLKRGGVDVLDTVPLTEETQYKVEAILQPTFAGSDGRPVHQSQGMPLVFTDKQIHNMNALCYSFSAIDLPEIPNALCEDTLLVWEAFRLETELIVMCRGPSSGFQRQTNNVGGIEGPQYYFWAVGGNPLDVMGILPQGSTTYETTALVGVPQNTPTVASPLVQGRVTGPNYPIEGWVPDPTRNDNTRYFGRMVGGSVTPPVVTFGNMSTTPLVDEYGIGPLALHGKVYLTSADQEGLTGFAGTPTLVQAAQARAVQACPGRFFRIHFRQRRVKNPYSMEMLYKQMLTPQAPKIEGAQKAIVEVTMEKSDHPIPPTIDQPVVYPASGPVIFTNGELMYPPRTSPDTDVSKPAR